MKPLNLQQLAAWTDGSLHGAANVPVERIVIDSRDAAVGSLFVALPGERVDGHEYVASAAAQGASAAMVTRLMPVAMAQLLVADPLTALAAIATALRLQRDTLVLAHTGSNGKTTVKALLHGILQGAGRAYCNAGNRNNELGMPLALIDQPEDAQFAVYEMGAGQPGDIAHLAAIARPQIALVNNIGAAHLERMGSLLGVAETKAAIYDALPVGGTAVINADDAFAPWFEARLARQGCRLMRFAIDAGAEVQARDIQLEPAGSRFRLLTPGGEAAVALALPGRHNIANALAAAAMALAAGVPLRSIVDGLAAAQPIAGRQQEIVLACGARLLDDSYNANPGSVAAAIATLATLPGERWLVLGDMRELGPEADRLHRDIGERARAAGLQRLYTVGCHAAEASAGFGTQARHFANQADLIAALRQDLAAGVQLLVKGSRGSRMDRVVDALADRPENAHAA